MSHLSRQIVTLMPLYSMQIFPNFGLAVMTTIEQICPIYYPAQYDRKWYARGRTGIICDTRILGDVTFIATNRHTDAYILNAFFSQFCVSSIDDK